MAPACIGAAPARAAGARGARGARALQCRGWPQRGSLLPENLAQSGEGARLQ